MTKEDLYYRYFSEISEFTHEDLANMTQIDYDREMAFVAVRHRDEGDEIWVSRGQFPILTTSMPSLPYWSAPI